MSHPITSPISLDRRLVLLPAPAWIEELEVRRRSLEIQQLLQSSPEAFARAEIITTESGECCPRKATPAAVPPRGRRHRPRAHRRGRRHAHRRAVYRLLPARDFQQSFPGNLDLIVNSINWVFEREETISVRPKFTLMLPLRLNSLSTWIFTGAVVVVVPLIVLGAGLVVWLRRRHL